MIELSYGKIYLGQNVESLEVTPRFDAYTGVSVKADSNSTAFTAGNTNGRVLEVTCQYASQAVANNILSQVNGYSYQPFSAGGALIEPAAEIGDGVTVGSVYGGLFSQNTNFGHLSSSTVAAPTDEELAHEFGYIGDDGKYATYASLANGTASVNGAGIQDRTIRDVKVVNNTLGTGEFSGGVNSSLGYADYSNGVFNGWNRASYINASSGDIGYLNVSTLARGGTDLQMIAIYDSHSQTTKYALGHY